MLRLYIVRHGETEFNVQKRMQGRMDSPLSQRGIEHAKALGEHLKVIHFLKLYSSPSPRAYRTAELIKGDRELEIISEDRLREINLAHWEGKTKMELEKLYPEEYHVFWNEPHRYKPMEGDSFQQVQDRAIEFLNMLAAQNPEGNILIVTHSVVIKTIIAYYKGYSMEKLWAPPLIQDTSVTILEVEQHEARLVVTADTAHIT